MISFTGSAAVGWKIKEKCNIKKVCRELGGNAAAIVHDDAELQSKIAPIATGAFGYARPIVHQHTEGLFAEPDLRSVS